jgi:hypothetical protein
MSANLRKRLTLGMVLLCVIAWALCLPWLTTKLVWIGGKHGYCPLRLLVHIALLFCAIAFAIPVVGIISLKSKGKSAIALGVIFWVLAAGWSIITIHRNTVSGNLMKEYCRGFSETIQSHIDVAGLNEFFPWFFVRTKRTDCYIGSIRSRRSIGLSAARRTRLAPRCQLLKSFHRRRSNGLWTAIGSSIRIG